MSRRVVSAALAVAITAAALYFLITPEILATLRTAIATADPVALAAALALVLCVQYLRAWRFSALTFGRTALPSAPMVRITLQLNFLNFALPFRLGEFGYPALMRTAFAEPVLRSLGVLLVARLLDLASVGAILLALAAWLGIASPFDGFAMIAASALAIGPVVMILAKSWAAKMLARFGTDRPALASAAARLDAIATGAALGAFALSLALWLVFGLAAALIAGAAVEGVSPLVAMLGAAGGNLAFALPVNGVLGLGPSQAAFVALAVPAGAPFDAAVAAALILHAIVLASAFVFGGLASLLPARSHAATKATNAPPPPGEPL